MKRRINGFRYWNSQRKGKFKKDEIDPSPTDQIGNVSGDDLREE